MKSKVSTIRFNVLTKHLIGIPSFIFPISHPMKKITLSKTLSISPIVHGHWRMVDWKLSQTDTEQLFREAVNMGITTFDHADIYGDYSCEAAFGKVLKHYKSLRQEIQIITKCGIKLISDKYPTTKIKHYDYSYKHIVTSVENSLRHLNTGYIDLLLLHRPSPFFKPEEVAAAFSHLRSSGKVLHFGVSNYSPLQYTMLESYLEVPLVTNQVEISPYCLEHFENENIDFFLRKRIKPMAWSPLAGGRLFDTDDPKSASILAALAEVGEELGSNTIDKTIYSWLLSHPAGIVPIVGSQKIERLQAAVDAINLKMNVQQWSRIYTASTGVDLP